MSYGIRTKAGRIAMRAIVAQRRTRARRQSEIRGGKTPHASSRRATERGLRLPVGQRREGRTEREILRAVRGQEHAAALLVHVRSELGQSLSFLHVAGRWVRSNLVSGHSRRRFVAIAKAPAERINAWAKRRGWSQIALVSGSESPYQADYKCQGDTDDMQWPVMHVFRRQDGKIFHFWGTETMSNHLDTVWAYWNLMDFTPEGRPDILTPPQTSGPNSWRNTI